MEIEYWSTLPETHPTGKGRIDALKLSEQANAEYFRIKYAEPGGANIEKMIASLAAGTPPNLVVDYPYFAARLHIKDGLIDYEKELKAQPAWARARANLSPAFLEGIQWLGAMVGIPFQISQQAMVYAPDKLEKAGVRAPNGLTWTWADFEEIAKRAAKPPDVWGLSVGWRSSGYTTWAASNGTSWLSKDGTKISFTHPEGMAGVELLTRLTNGLRLMPLGANQKSAGELIVKGQTVFEPNGPYRLPAWKQAGVTRVEGVPFPRGPHKPTTYNWGTLYSFIVFKSTDPAKQRAVRAGRPRRPGRRRPGGARRVRLRSAGDEDGEGGAGLPPVRGPGAPDEAVRGHVPLLPGGSGHPQPGGDAGHHGHHHAQDLRPAGGRPQRPAGGRARDPGPPRR